MREILFRGKSIYTCKWGESVCPLGVMHSGHLCDDFIPETVGQFIGLRDKYGTKVFEGDIVKINAIGVYKGVVCWDGEHMSFVVKNTVYNHTYSVNNAWYHPDYSVIGNIHDNPELLNGGFEDGK